MPAEPPVFVMPYFHESQESARYLRRALDGLLAQTDPYWHLVIVDDGSPLRDAQAAVHESCGADQCRITRIGSSYYLIKAIVDRDGFVSALRLALEAGTVDTLDAAALFRRFLNRLASTLQAEGRHALAQDVLADRIPAIDAVLQPLSTTTGP